MATPPPYENITGIYTVIDKHHAVSKAAFAGSARPGQIIVDTSDYTLHVGDASGQLAQVGGAGPVLSDVATSGDYADLLNAPDLSVYATETYVDTAISDLIDSSPAALDTLGELAAALNDDSNFASTVTTLIGTKADASSLATVATSGDYADLSNVPNLTVYALKTDSVVGANVVGNVTSAITANFANFAGNITIAAQPNITSVGTLTSATISGNLTTSGTTILTGFTETVTSPTFSATFAPNVAQSSIIKITATSDFTFNGFTSPVTGQSATVIVTQDGTGSRLLTSTMKFAGGAKTLSTTAGSVDVIGVFYDGSTYYASLTLGYA